MIYQLMFAIITPALISGAFAERMKFSAMLLFMALWSLLVYFPMAHMVWGKGGLLNAFLGGTVPLLRFRRRHGGAHHLGCFGAGVRAVPGQAPGVSQRTDEAAQPGAELHRRLPAVGGLVRIQRRQRAGVLGAGHQRLRGHAFRRGGGDAGLGAGGVDQGRQAERAGRRSRVPSPDWWRSRRPRGSSSRCRRLRSGLPRASSAISWSRRSSDCSATTIRSTRSACTAPAERWGRC